MPHYLHPNNVFIKSTEGGLPSDNTHSTQHYDTGPNTLLSQSPQFLFENISPFYREKHLCAKCVYVYMHK